MTDETTQPSVTTAALAGLKPKPVNVHVNDDGSARLQPTGEKPAEDRELNDEERAALAKEHQAGKSAADKNFDAKVAERAKALDEKQPEGPQELRIRPGIHSHRLGMVIQRADGGYTAVQLSHRAMQDVTLNPGDKLVISPLGADTLSDFMRLADMAPADGEQA